jgi:hypothetical protein
MRFSEFNNNSIEMLSMFTNVATTVLSIVGFMVFVAGIVSLKKYADNPHGETTLGQSLTYIVFSIFLTLMPYGLKGMNATLFPDSSEAATYAAKPIETKPYVAPIIVKRTEPSKPLIIKKDPINIPVKPVDYKQFFIAVGSVIGAGLVGFLTVFGIIKLRTKLRIRKYQKVVSNVVELNNDFVSLSEHITIIDTCLDDIKRYRVGAPNKIKSSLDSMQNILEHKKQMFNKSVREIHEMQPELKVLGGLV